MKNKDAIMFQIDQLRKDKIIYAVDAMALDLGALLFLNFGFSVFPIPQEVAFSVATAVLTIPLLFTVYALVSNIFRHKKIKDLEKKL